MKTPTIKAITQLLVSLKPQICDDYRCSEDPEDDTPGITVTVGADDAGNWSYQTGDNSFTGGAYGYPHWGVVSLYRDSNCRELARDVVDQIADAQSW